MTDQKQNVTRAVDETAKNVERQLNAKDTKKEEKTFTLKSGVVLKLKEVPQVVYVDLRNSLPEPSPPIFYNENTGKNEPNMNDPRFKADYANWQVAMSTAIMDLSILFGSEIVSIPDDMPTPDDPEFKSDLRIILGAMGHKPEEIRSMGAKTRYIYWLKYVATQGRAGKDEELDRLFTAIGRLSGVPEEDVEAAVDGFRD
jgi:hypothetical protein